MPDLDLFSLQSPPLPFVLNCPPGSNCNSRRIEVPCGDEFVTVEIPPGATNEEKRALLLDAFSACQPKNAFDDPHDPPTEGDPTQFYYSRAASCTQYCSTSVSVVDGAPVVTRTSPFTYTLLAGSFIGTSQESADATARSLACVRAKEHLVCLSAIQKAFCVDEGFEATIRATGRYVSQFPHSNLWEISGTLPPGLTFHGGFVSGNKVIIDGTPTTAGLYTFTVKITLGYGPGQGDQMSREYTMAIVEIDTATPLPELVIGTPYLENLTVIPTHDQETEVWSVVDGTLPAGLELTPAGILHGTPSETGAFPFIASVTLTVNGTSVTCEKDFTFEAAPVFYWAFEDADLVGEFYESNSDDTLDIGPKLTLVSVTGKIGKGLNWPPNPLSVKTISTGFSSDLEYEGNGLSFACWFKVDSIGANTNSFHLCQYIAPGGPAALNFEVQYKPNITAIVVTWRKPSFIASDQFTFTPVIGQWHLIAVVYKTDGSVSYSVDGVALTALTGSVVLDATTSGELLMIKNEGASGSDFTVDEWGFWTGHSLTNSNITALWNSGNGVTWPNVPG